MMSLKEFWHKIYIDPRKRRILRRRGLELLGIVDSVMQACKLPSSVGTHTVIEKAILKLGQDYRVANADHPIKALSDRKKDNIEVARVKGK